MITVWSNDIVTLGASKPLFFSYSSFGGIIVAPAQRGHIKYDQIAASDRLGNGVQFLMSGVGTKTPGHVIVYDSQLNAEDGGPVPSGGITQLTGDGTAGPGSGSQALSVTKTGGVAFAASATTDTTNASNISSGTIGAALLPLGSSSAFGAVKVDGTTITASSGVISAVGGGGGALVLLESHTASSSAELDFTASISSTYDDYQIELIGIKTTTNGAAVQLQFSTNGGSSYDTSSIYDWGNIIDTIGSNSAGGNGQASVGGILLFADSSAGGLLSTATPGLAGSLKLYAPLDSSNYKFVDGRGVAQYTTGTRYVWTLGGVYRNTAAVNAFRIKMSSGNIASGIVRCYGISH